jgi:hypothetical protein
MLAVPVFVNLDLPQNMNVTSFFDQIWNLAEKQSLNGFYNFTLHLCNE